MSEYMNQTFDGAGYFVLTVIIFLFLFSILFKLFALAINVPQSVYMDMVDIGFVHKYIKSESDLPYIEYYHRYHKNYSNGKKVKKDNSIFNKSRKPKDPKYEYGTEENRKWREDFMNSHSSGNSSSSRNTSRTGYSRTADSGRNGYTYANNSTGSSSGSSYAGNNGSGQTSSSASTSKSYVGNTTYEKMFNGVTDKDSLKKRYRQLCREFHPDSNNVGSEEVIKEINIIYSKLEKIYK